METSLPLFCEEEEPPCRPVTHDVNNSLPPVVERGGGGSRGHESRRAWGRVRRRNKKKILSLESGGVFIENPVPRVRVESSCEESSVRIPLGESVRENPVVRVPLSIPFRRVP